MVARWMIAVAVSAAIAANAANGAVTNLEELVYDTMTVEDSDVRTGCLASIRDSRGLSDDEFSAILVGMANKDEVRKSPLLRGFTMGAIMDFGTTNALDFLENEALHGPDVAAGIDGFAIITGFDDRCFALLDKVTSDWGEANYRRRYHVYNLLNSALFPGSNGCMRCVNTNDLSKVWRHAIDFLVHAAEKEEFECAYLDQIITCHFPEYTHSSRRKSNLLKFQNFKAPSSYTANYFRNELRKLEAEEAQDSATNAPPLASASAGRGDGHPDYSRPVVFWAAVAVGIVGALVFVRKWRGK